MGTWARGVGVGVSAGGGRSGGREAVCSGCVVAPGHGLARYLDHETKPSTIAREKRYLGRCRYTNGKGQIWLTSQLIHKFGMKEESPRGGGSYFYRERGKVLLMRDKILLPPCVKVLVLKNCKNSHLKVSQEVITPITSLMMTCRIDDFSIPSVLYCSVFLL